MARPTYDIMFCDQLLADRTAQAERAVQAAVDAKNEVRIFKMRSICSALLEYSVRLAYINFTVLWIRDVRPGFFFIPDPRSECFPSHPHPGSASTNLSILTQKIVSKLSKI